MLGVGSGHCSSYCAEGKDGDKGKDAVVYQSSASLCAFMGELNVA